MNGDWRVWRPAIWLAMLGVALVVLVSPPYIGAVILGGAIGAAIRIRQRRHRTATTPANKTRKPSRRR
ncbi:MAG: hypothetical protein M3076_12510 [Actinomycetota bacterium]|nr:hypothetical protein [Actinomycetota bacterium]